MEDVENLSTNETYSKALTVIDTRSNEERLIDSLLNTPQFSKEPVRQRAELNMAQYYVNTDSANVSEQEFVDTARDTISKTYNERQQSLALRYNRDARNAQNTYSRLVEANSSDIMNVYVNGSQVDTSGGIGFSVPVDQNDTTNGTSVNVGGKSMQVATVTVNGTAYTYQDDLAVTVVDPAGTSPEVPVLGQDVAVSNDAGASQYNPADDGHSPSSADVVINDTHTWSDELSTSLSGWEIDTSYNDMTIYVSGSHDLQGEKVQIGASNVTLVFDDAEFTDHSSFTARGSDTTVKGLQLSGSNFYLQTADTVTFDHVTMTDISEAQGGTHIITDSIASTTGGSFSETNVHPYRFDSFTKQMIDTQQSDEDEILAAFGTTTSGYASDVFTELEAGTVGITDIVDYEQMFSQSFSEDDIGSRAWIDAQYAQAGMAGNTSSTVSLTVASGSTVYANADKSQDTTLSASKTYDGHLWTNNPPASGTWESNKTYDTANLGGKVFVTYFAEEEKLVGGEITVQTVPKTVAVEGEFTIDELIGKSGTSVDTVDHGGTANADPYNSSEYTDDITQVNQRLNDIESEIKNSGSGGTTGDACGIEVFGVCSGISYAQISIVGLVLIGIPVLYLIRPLFSTASNLSR
jgi:hypothetical protein